MDDQSVKGANLGVLLLIFGAILTLVLIVFGLSRGMANKGLTSITDKLKTADETEFSDFDGNVVVGERVKSALAGFKGKEVAILIATQGVIDKTNIAYSVGTALGTDLVNKQAWDKTSDTGILSKNAVVTGHENMTLAFALVPGRNSDNSVDMSAANRKGTPASSSGHSNDKQLVFVQYNALLEPTESTGVGKGGTTGHSCIWWNDGTYIFDGSFRKSDGKSVVDLLFTNTNTSGYVECIPGTARFNANLLKDSNGVILGIVLQQIGA